jgi:hypothetical protein
MFSAFFSFLGGSVFRMIWGEVSEFVNKRQDHKHEMEAMRLQSELETMKAEQELQRLRVASELGIKELEVKTNAEIEAKDADAFIAAMATVNVKTGNWFIDAWNGSIRPAAATTALLLWWFCLYTQGFVLTEWDKELVGVILGFYFAHRCFQNKIK